MTPGLRWKIALCLLIVFALGIRADAAQTVYTDEALYLSDLAAMGYAPMVESFEDDAAWGVVRQVAPSVTSQGITWTANNANSQVTTGSGPARTGNWGFYTLPHGDPANSIGDGWVGTSAHTLYGVGAWIDTNTPVAKAGLFLDGDSLNPVDLGETCIIVGEDEECTDNALLSGPYKFFGVIETHGFTSFHFNELEGTPGDQKYIYSDDYTFAVVPGTPTPTPTVTSTPTDTSTPTPTATPAPVKGDMNGDRCVTFEDLPALSSTFGHAFGDAEYRAEADMDDSGAVDFADLPLFSQSFGNCY